MYYLYIITNKVNDKIYIGKTKNPTKRWRKHLNPDARALRHQAISRSISKYGKDNFIFEIIKIVDTEQEAFELEKFWISEIRRFGVSNYNLTDGGEGASGFKHSQETKNYLSEIKLGIPFSETHKDNLSIAKIGLPSPNKGKEFSEAHKLALSKSHSGKFLSEEHKTSISNNAAINPNFGFSGRIHTQESAYKISLSHTGKEHSLSTINKMSESRQKYCSENREKLLDKNTKIVWPSNEDLLNMVNDLGFSEVGRRLNVSGNSVKGRLKRRGLL